MASDCRCFAQITIPLYDTLAPRSQSNSLWAEVFGRNFSDCFTLRPRLDSQLSLWKMVHHHDRDLPSHLQPERRDRFKLPLVGLAAFSPCCIPTRPTGASYAEASTISISPRIVSHLFRLDLIGTDNFLASDSATYSEWDSERRSQSACLGLSSRSALSPVGRYRQSPRVLHFTAVPLRQIGILPLRLVYSPAIA
jgi:hypothetical protein